MKGDSDGDSEGDRQEQQRRGRVIIKSRAAATENDGETAAMIRAAVGHFMGVV